MITLDLNMPGFHGAEIAEIFKNKDLKVPVLIISGALNASIEETASHEGHPPFSFKAL